MVTYRSAGDTPVFVPPEGLAQPPPAPPPAPPGGPGTELKALLASLGLRGEQGCGCTALAAQMDAWGVEGCKLFREPILARLREQQQALGWLAWFQAAGKAALSGLAFTLDWGDPAEGLLNEAIRRAEVKHRRRGGQP